MIYEKIYLKDINKNIKTNAYFEFIRPICFDSAFPPSPLAVILPGGGYFMTSSRESDPIALKFLNLGYASLVVRYTCTEDGKNPPLYPYPYLEVISAIKYVYENRERLNVDMSSVNVIGFSAGGHLAASYGYLYKDKELLDLCDAKVEEVRPTSICLGYSTILPENPLRSSIVRLTNGEEKLVDKISVIKHVDETYPRTFIWGTDDDNVVNSIHSKTMDKTLTENNVEHVYYNYPHGPHGLSTADFLSCDESSRNEEIAKWINNYDNFVKNK